MCCVLAFLSFTAALELDANNVALYTNRATARWAMQQYEEGLADCDRALEINSKWVKVPNESKTCTPERSFRLHMG